RPWPRATVTYGWPDPAVLTAATGTIRLRTRDAVMLTCTFWPTTLDGILPMGTNVTRGPLTEETRTPNREPEMSAIAVPVSPVLSRRVSTMFANPDIVTLPDPSCTAELPEFLEFPEPTVEPRLSTDSTLAGRCGTNTTSPMGISAPINFRAFATARSADDSWRCAAATAALSALSTGGFRCDCSSAASFACAFASDFRAAPTSLLSCFSPLRNPENTGLTPLALYSARTAAAVPGPYFPDASAPVEYPDACRPA